MSPADRQLALIARAYGVTVAEIRGPGRPMPLVQARVDFIAWARARGKYSYPRIGQILRRHHSTIIYLHQRACARVQAQQGGATFPALPGRGAGESAVPAIVLPPPIGLDHGQCRAPPPAKPGVLPAKDGASP